MISDNFISHIEQLFGFNLVCLPFNKSVSSNLLLRLSDGTVDFVAKLFRSSYSFNTELTVLLKCQERLKVPEIVYFEEKKQSGWDWILYRYIQGTSLYELKEVLNPTLSQLLFHEIGRELSRFHNVKLIYKLNKLEKKNIVKKIIFQTEIAYHAIPENKNSDLFLRTIHFSRGIYPLLENMENYSIAIKDFNDKHIIIQTDFTPWSLNGIIDFEQTVYSNKFLDTVSLYIDYFFDDKDLETLFWKGYGITITERDKRLIAFFILQYALELCGILREIHVNNVKLGKNIISKVFEWLK